MRIRLISAKVEVEVEAELGKNMKLVDQIKSLMVFNGQLRVKSGSIRDLPGTFWGILRPP